MTTELTLMRPRSSGPWPVCLSLVLLAASGCEEPRHVGGSKRSVPTAPSAADAAPPPEAPKAEVSHGEILGQRTQDVRKLTPEEEKKTQAASTRITARDPITLSGNAYVVAIGQVATGNIKHAMDLYNA